MAAGGNGPGPARARPDRSSTLDLPLPIEAPGPPRRLEPEEPVTCAAAFDGEGWRFGVDWDGMRVILSATASGRVRVHDERLRDVGQRLSEITAAAATALHGRAAVVDGVVTLLDSRGCPDLGGLFERLAGGGGRAPMTGLVLLAGDLLHLDSASLLAWPFDRRRAALVEVLATTPHVQLPDVVASQGRAVAEAAAQRGLGAIVARQGSAPYRPGVASPQRLRVPLEARADAVVVGAVATPVRGGEVSALLLAEWEDGHLVDAGRVAVGREEALQRWLRGRISALRRVIPPLENVAADADGAGVTWLTPSLVATVRHHGRGDDGRLRLPAPVAIREDRPVRWCIRRPPVPPPQTAPVPRADFRPTVITTLPLGE